MLFDELVRESDSLGRVIKNAQESLESAPEGSLRISSSHGKNQFIAYIGSSEGKPESSMQYIRKADVERARRLAQKDYDMRIVKVASAEKKAIDKLIGRYPDVGMAAVRAEYDSLSSARKTLVSPYALPDGEYAQQWQSAPFEGLDYGKSALVLETDRGELVRSKSEVIIANKLAQAEVPYRYEAPLRLGGRTVYPDFTVLNVRTRELFYWEHFGMMDDDAYLSDALSKLELYARAGIILGKQLIATFESSGKPLGTKVVDACIQGLLK